MSSIQTILKSLTFLEIVLIVVLVVYLILPIQTPTFLTGVVDSPLGMLVLFCITVYLFLYANPVLAILYIFVAYELLRRSSIVTGHSAYIQYTPTQERRDAEMIAMNPPKQRTLEEEVVTQMAPIGKSPMGAYADSSFKPIADKLHGASLI
jgi:hypothetical protein